MSQEDAANHLGVSRPTLVQIEDGSRSVSGLVLEKLAYLFGRDLGEFVADAFQEQDALVALFRAQGDGAGQPAALENLRECMVMGRELTNLERLVGTDRDLAASAAHRFLGLALEAFRRDEISRGKLRELAAMVGLSRSELDRLIEDAGIGE